MDKLCHSDPMRYYSAVMVNELIAVILHGKISKITLSKKVNFRILPYAAISVG